MIRIGFSARKTYQYASKFEVLQKSLYLVEDGLQYLGSDGDPVGLNLGQPVVVLHQDTVPFQTLTVTELQGTGERFFSHV